VSPIISVITPTYNRRDVVGRAVQSVLDQGMGQFELIVVDDGSDDGTVEYLSTIDDARLTVISQKNAGVCVARNVGVAACSAPFVTFLDSDDEACAGWLDYYAGAIRNGIQLASCGMHFVGPGELHKLVLPEPGGRTFGDLHARFLTGAFGLEKELFDAVGGFRPGLRFSENTDLGLRLGGRMIDDPFTSSWTDEPLVNVYRGEAGYDPSVQYESAMTMLRENAEHLRRSRKLHAIYLCIAGVAASRLGSHAESRQLLGQAIRVNPFAAKNYLRLGREVVRRG
jgi:glycosyltransferase involved in cell wall biosynthesis